MVCSLEDLDDKEMKVIEGVRVYLEQQGKLGGIVK